MKDRTHRTVTRTTKQRISVLSVNCSEYFFSLLELLYVEIAGFCVFVLMWLFCQDNHASCDRMVPYLRNMCVRSLMVILFQFNLIGSF